MDPYALPHHLFNRQRQRTQLQAADLDSILCPPHLLMEMNSRHQHINKDLIPAQDQTCRLPLYSLQSPAASPEDDPTVSTCFLLNDCTVLLIPFPGGSGDDYTFPHPLNNSINSLYENKASDLSSLFESCRSAVHAMIPPDFPIETQYRGYFEEEIGKFLHGVAREAAESGLDMTAYVTCFLDRRVRYTETAEFAKEMETATEGRWRDKGVEEMMWECPVCLKEMDTGTWSEGVRLLCGHKFHGKCIAPWLTKKTTCPMCRCDQVPIRLLLAQKSVVEG